MPATQILFLHQVWKRKSAYDLLQGFIGNDRTNIANARPKPAQ